MLVSIILPCYNHAQYLPSRIDSILNQTYENFELIILDDCSTDSCAKIISSYKNHPKVSHCIINEHNSGSTFAQWNKGVELAQGDLIWIAESDDVADINFLTCLITKFKLNSDLVLAYSQSFRMNSVGVVTGDWKSHTDDLNKDLFNNDFSMSGLDYIKKFFKNKNTIPNASAVVFKKDVFLEVGATNPELKYIGDWDLWYRILSKGDIYYHSECLNFFRYHDSSVIAKAFKDNKKPIELEIQGILFFKNLLIVFKDDPELNYRLKCSLKHSIKNTVKLALKQKCINHRHLSFALKHYLHFIFKLRSI